MIHSVTANKETFHPVTFTEGLNLIVAERSQTATDTDSRNGLGKSTLIRIIDFCLASDPNKKGTLPTKYLEGWEFTLDLDVRGRRVKVTRAVDDDKVVKIEGDVSGWPILPEGLALNGYHTYTIDEWKKILGWALFDLPNVAHADAELTMPSSRSLLHFFIRKTFDDPLQPIPVQKVDSMAVAYLLGLNWEYISRINGVKQREEDAKTTQSAAKLELKKWEKTEKALKAECTYLESQMATIREQLANFNVLPGYEEIEQSVNALTVEIHGLKNKVISEQNRLGAAKRQLDRARASLEPVDQLYAECGLIFPDAVKERIENVRRFHEEVTGNRRIILEREIRALGASIAEANARVLAKSEEKREAMQILKTHNALGEYTALNQRYTDMARELQRKLDCLQHLKESKESLAAFKEEKTEIADEAKVEYEELRPTWEESENYFSQLTRDFYQAPGSLNISLTAQGKSWGFKFDPRVESDDSEGIKKIKIFSFDATLFHQQRVCEHPIDFLIHDSMVCDSTDPRQVAKAFLVADRISREMHGQYICAINSDKLNEQEFKELMPLEQSRAFTRLTLSDASDATKLLGISFGRETVVPTVSTITVPVLQVEGEESSEALPLPPPEDNQ